MNEYIEDRILEDTHIEADHILNNQPELYNFWMDNLWSLENLSNVYAANYRGLYKRTRDQLVSQQIEMDVLTECKTNVRHRYYDE